MRELIYLSRAKLAQFTHTERSGWKSSVDAKVQLPLVGEVSATASRENSEDTRRFEKIVSVLERSAPPYTDEVSTGTWVSFWVPMTYTIIEAIRLTSEGEDSPVRYGPALAFIDVDAGGELSVPRLMLHGDADNLVGTARSPEPPRISPWRMGGPSIAKPFFEILKALATDDFLGRTSADYIAEAVKLLDRMSVAETATRVSGLARVTGNFTDQAGRRIVMATPLYVQYAAHQSGKIRRR